MDSPNGRDSIPRCDSVTNAPRKGRAFPFSTVVVDVEQLKGEERLGGFLVSYEFHFVLGQMKLFVSSLEDDDEFPDKKIILREKDWWLSKKMVKNAMRGKTEQPESVSSLWKSDSTDEESVYFRVFCVLKTSQHASSLTFTRRIGEEEEAKEKVQEITCPLSLWNKLVENEGERIDHLFQRSKMYRSVIKVSRCIFPTGEVEGGETGEGERLGGANGI